MWAWPEIVVLMPIIWKGYLSVNSPELIFDLVNAKPGTDHSTNPTNPNGNSKR